MPTAVSITPTEPATRVTVELVDGRHRLRTRAGLLRPQRLHGPDDRVRVALVGQTALLLGGDEVVLDVEVGPGATLELSDVAGTVAYAGRGRAASWHTRIRLGAGARLRYDGQPLVVGDGADVTRTLTLDLAAGAAARLRETVVLGRAGERGGPLDARSVVRRTGIEIHRERLRLHPDDRERPGLLAGVRVLDSVLELVGSPPPDPGPVDDGADRRPPDVVRTDLVRYVLLEPGSTLTRFLGTGLADSPVT